MTVCLEAVDIIPAGFAPENDGVVGSLANVDHGTVMVALAAGVAAIISFETRASTAVGVAISITTIPAAAYVGVALGLGEYGDGLGALLVLLTNITAMLASGCLTLYVQRRMADRAAAHPGPVP